MLAKLGYGMVARVKGLPQNGSLESVSQLPTQFTRPLKSESTWNWNHIHNCRDNGKLWRLVRGNRQHEVGQCKVRIRRKKETKLKGNLLRTRANVGKMQFYHELESSLFKVARDITSRDASKLGV